MTLLAMDPNRMIEVDQDPRMAVFRSPQALDAFHSVCQKDQVWRRDVFHHFPASHDVKLKRFGLAVDFDRQFKLTRHVAGEQVFRNRPPLGATKALGVITAFQTDGHEAIVEAILDEPAAGASQVQNLRCSALREQFVQFVVEPTVDTVVTFRTPGVEMVG